MICNKTSGRILSSLIILLFCITNEFSGLYNSEEGFEKIFNLIYNQQFNEASLELVRAKNKLDKWEYHMLNLDLLWWEAVSGNSREDYARFESALENYSSDLKHRQGPDSLEELINLSYSFRLAALKSNLLPMMLDFLRINHIIQRLETDKLTMDQQEIFNIYLALFSIGKSKLLFNNTRLREEGIEILESSLTSLNPVYQTISCYFLSKIYLELEQSPAQARIYCEQLCKTYPGNKIFIYNLELCRRLDSSM